MGLITNRASGDPLEVRVSLNVKYIDTWSAPHVPIGVPVR